MKSEQVILNVETGMVGSKRSCGLGYTVDEWSILTEDEKTEIINETMANIANVWTTTENGVVVD